MIGWRVLPPAAGSPWRRRCSLTIRERRFGSRRGRHGAGSTSTSTLPDDETATRGVKVSVRPECFTGGIEQIDWQRRKPYDEFDYGYVLTVHKSQGSQWDLSLIHI